MNGKQLKNSILQWAIQGKLVPQDPNDEPASVLLDKIRQEKERLIKGKKIKRDKNASIIYRGEDNSYYEKILATGEVKCIDEEIPFEIPKGWEWCRLRDIIIFIGGYAYDSHSFLEKSEYQVLRLGNIKNDTINKSVNPVFIDEILAQDTVRFRCLKNDILVTMTGTRKKRDYFYTVLIDTDHSNMYFNQRVGCLRAIYSPIALWLNKVLKAETILHQVFQYETGTANQGNLGASNIMNTLIPLPPVTEQFRIVKKLEEVHTYVFQYDKAQCELDILNFGIRNTIKKSLVQEAIQGKLVPQITEEGTAQELLEQIKEEKLKLVKEGKLKKLALNDSVIFRGDDNKYYEKIGKKCVDITEEIPFPIPAKWQWVRIRDVFQLNPKNEADDETLAAFIPMEKVSAGYKSDFTFDLVKWGNIKKGFTHFANGDVAFAKITPCFQNRKSAIFHGLPNGIGAGTTELKVLRPYGNTIGRWYLLYFLESPYFIDEATFKGTANQQRIVVGYLENKLFPLPPKEEQQRIVAQIEKLFEQLR